MSLHMTWGLVGFGIALVFVWVYHMLKTRGVTFFWYHPLVAGMILLLTLVVLESLFADMSDATVALNTNLMILLGVPVALFVGILFYRAARMRKK